MQGLNTVVKSISDAQGRLDGLIAAAGIQQETSALDYTQADANMMFEVNVTGTLSMTDKWLQSPPAKIEFANRTSAGVFMTAQAVAKEMIRWGNGGSIAMIASMSGSVANRVSIANPKFTPNHNNPLTPISGPHLPRLQRLQSRRLATRPQPRLRMGLIRHPRQHHLPRLHRNRNGGGSLRKIPRAQTRLADAEYAGQVEFARGVQRCGGVLH